jgi:hypothetical protein
MPLLAPRMCHVGDGVKSVPGFAHNGVQRLRNLGEMGRFIAFKARRSIFAATGSCPSSSCAYSFWLMAP